MKALFLLSALAATTLAQTGQSANFTNTSFTGPFSVGQPVSLMWTTGNGSPITLTITNATYIYHIFVDRAVVPNSYTWIVTAPPGFAPGEYRLALAQAGGGTVISPSFGVVAAGSSSTTTTTTTMTTTMTTPMAAATVTFVYWDDDCSCHKTGSALTPLNTSIPVTTTRVWDAQCGCHLDTVVPVTTLSTQNNYTAPSVVPPLVTTSAPQTATQTPPATAATTPATFKGNAIKLGGSISGVLMMMAAIALA